MSSLQLSAWFGLLGQALTVTIYCEVVEGYHRWQSVTSYSDETHSCSGKSKCSIMGMNEFTVDKESYLVLVKFNPEQILTILLDCRFVSVA